MTDDTQPPVALADLRLILRNTQRAASDARVAREAAELSASGFGRRHNTSEARLTELEERVATLERNAVAEIFARLNLLVADAELTERQLAAVREHFEELGRLLRIKTAAWPYPRRDDDEGMLVEP